LNENGFSERNFTGTFLENRNTFATQRLQDAPVIQALVVWIAVDVGQDLTVDRGITQSDNNLRFEVVLTFMVCVEWIAEVVGNAIVVSF
jgi:hypothetical protein